MTDKLTKAQVIRAGAYSTKPAVKQAYKKLEFALSLSHSRDEIEELGDEKSYHMRLSTKNGNTYDNLVLRWCEDEMCVYAPRSSVMTTGSGNLLSESDPAIMYIQTESQERNY
jgi:hypothetical protein